MTTDENCQALQRKIMRDFDDSRKRTEQGLKRQKANDWFSEAKKWIEEIENVKG